MKRLLLIFSLFAFALFANGQTKTVTGTVTDAKDGSPLPGVGVVVSGTTTGTISGMDGKYTLKVSSSVKTLHFSFIGMKNQDKAIPSNNIVNVALSEDAEQLDEVMVVAYGTSTKSSFTGSATQVSGDKLASKNTVNLTQSLAGESAGVQVINSNGQPGSTSKVFIRGFGSVNGTSAPLYIVDGSPLQGDINSINPSDVESTTILKDASATAIYGSRGANGVVMITTKKGKNGVSKIDVDVKYGINMRLLPDYDVISSPEQYTELSYQALYNYATIKKNSNPSYFANDHLFDGGMGLDPHYNMWNADGDKLIDPATGKFITGITRKYTPENWRDQLFKTSKRTETNVKLSGGTSKDNYYTSFGFLDDNGYYLNSNYQRFTGRSNINHQIKKWLKGGMNMNYARSITNNAGQGENASNGFTFVNNIPSIYPVYARNDAGELVPDKILGGNVFDYGDGQYGNRRFGSLNNPVATNTYDLDQLTSNMFGGNANLEASFLKYFKFRTQFGLEYVNTDRDNLSNPWYGAFSTVGGHILKQKEESFGYTFTNMLTYTRSFELNNFSAFIAHEASSYEDKVMSDYKTNLANPYNTEFNNAVVSSPASSYTDNYKIESYFGQVKYDYDEKYFAQAVIRRDGSSRFINNKWGNFGSLGLAWMATKENFMQSSSSWLKELKLKASYGVIGSEGILDDYGYSDFYPGEDLYTVSNINDQTSLTLKRKGNPNLTWESSTMFQLGVEFKIKNILDGSIDYYSKNTSNLFFQRRVPPSLGYAIINVNDGKLKNSGLEFNFITHAIKGDGINLDITLNGAFMHNEITHMPIEPATGEEKVLDQQGIYGRSAGHSMYDFYIPEYAGVDPSTGHATWYKYYNEVNGVKTYIPSMTQYLANNKGNIGTIGKEPTTVYSDATHKYIGKSAIPVVQGAFSFDLNYKGFELTSQFTYSLGGYGYDSNYQNLMSDEVIGNRNWSTDILKSWKKEGDVTNVPRMTAGLWDVPSNKSSRFVTSTDYLSLNNIQLSYILPKSTLKKLKISRVKLWVSGDNLWIGTKRKGFNPSTSEVGNSSTYTYSPLSTITSGISLQF